jgi:hypothetical protein
MFRLFNVNYYDSQYVLNNESFTRYEQDQNQIPKNICDKLTLKSGIENLFSFSYKSITVCHEKQNSLFLKTSSKCCPNCLNEEVFQRYSWGINLINVCTKHKVYLIEKCSVCNNKWTLNSLFRGHCNRCGQKIIKIDVEEVSEKVIIESQMEIENLLLNQKKHFLGIFDLEDFLIVILGFAQLFHGLRSFYRPNLPIYKMSYTNKIPYEKNFLVNIIADLYWLFHDFNKHFPMVLEAFFKQDQIREVRKRKKKFEAIIQSSRNLNFIFELYQNYRLEHYIRNMNMPKNIKSFDNQAAIFIQSNYLTNEQIKSKFGLVNSEMSYLMRYGSLKDCFLYNGKTTYFFKNKTEKCIRAFLKEKSDKLTFSEGAKILGIHVDRVPNLLKAGLLKSSSHIEKDKHLSKKQINQLLKSLKVKIISHTENKLSFSRCFQKYATSGLSVSLLLSFIQTSELLAYTNKYDYKLSDLFFDPIALSNQLKKNRLIIKGINLKQVSEELGFSERTILKMVESGLLSEPTFEKLNKRAFAYRFDFNDVELFKKTFSSVEQLIYEYNVTESLVRNAIYRGRLRNYLTGICRKTIVNKREFENYLNKAKDH